MSTATKADLEVSPESILGAPEPRPFMGPKTLLLGGVGAGKTWSLSTIVEAGYELFVIITDPGGEETLIDSIKAKDLPFDNVHWAYCASATPSWDTMLEIARKISLLTYEDLGKLKSGIGKADYRQWMQFLELCANFKCDRTGEEYGPIDSWGPERVFVIDSLSGLNTMAKTLAVGAKPTMHQGEWGVAMGVIEGYLQKLTGDVKCPVVVTAHLEREVDEVIGSTVLMVSTLGRKLAPKVPRDFSEVVHAWRDGTDFFWSTTTSNMALKTRTLPMKDKLLPSFEPLLRRYEERVAATQT